MWESLTREMGYWVNMHDPVYHLRQQIHRDAVVPAEPSLYKKGLLYKGYTIQPYSPAAGTGLSNHELNQPGCYRDVKDTTCTAQLDRSQREKRAVVRRGRRGAVLHGVDDHAVDVAVEYRAGRRARNPLRKSRVVQSVYGRTDHRYPGQKSCLHNFFPKKNEELPLDGYGGDGKNIPYRVMRRVHGQRPRRRSNTNN